MEIREQPGEPGHSHVTAVWARDGAGPGGTRWNVVQLVEAVRAGERFHVGEPGRGSAALRPAVCGRCRAITIVSDPPEALARMPACGDDD